MVEQPSLLVNILVVLGESFWILSAAAQLRRLFKTRNIRGLSAASQTLNGAANVAWCVYFASHHLWFPVATNLILLVLTVGLISFTLPARRQFVKGLLTIAVVGPLTSYVLLEFPAQAGWFAMAYNWAASTPWLIHVVSRKKVSGISEKSLFFSVGAMSLVLAYALLIHSSPLIVGCLQGLVYVAVITVYYYRYRRHD